ncbi:AAA family ATPase [Corallococcus exercitus]|uniref:MoxR family ATPase n=1 Tax=Corallococcus exercitus TaxID=2316736 RepID=A0A7Y4JM05_9BACT|nr:MoxR family ATPase [Corallococcus exercitus]NOK07500.1 MoxR family ATPase [Corallococcus exercitus]
MTVTTTHKKILSFNRTFFDLTAAHKRWGASDALKPTQDQMDARRYEARDEIVMAISAALVTKRPLLVHGPPGSGKSSLAGFAAEVLGWRYYEHVITSRTQAQDLLWSFDAIRRLSDTQAQKQLAATSEYIDPGVLWWAFNPDAARRRGARCEEGLVASPLDKLRWGQSDNAVVLLDEIDKADPFVPNDLLVPLSDGWFDVTEINVRVTLPKERQVLLILTTNGERELAPAFLRRCVQLRLDAPDKAQLEKIARLHFGEEDAKLHAQVANKLVDLRDSALKKRVRQPSTAEFLDAIRACRDLGIGPGDDEEWKRLSESLLEKPSTFTNG